MFVLIDDSGALLAQVSYSFGLFCLLEIICKSHMTLDTAYQTALCLLPLTVPYYTFCYSLSHYIMLLQGRPTGILPDLQERATNYQIVRNSKYAMAANALGVSISARSNNTITRAG